MDEAAALSEFAKTGSDRAFAELARPYVDLVYSSARRQVGGDAHLAEDVTQAVFIVLARKANSISTSRPLSAWLMKVTSYCAANARRSEARRQTHERRAGEMARSNDVENEGAAWDSLSPLLDEGMSKLKPGDRDVLLLRFFEKKSVGQVAAALGVSEEAAQKRVSRAVERLRDFFRRRGATVSAGALAALLASETTHAAPVSLASAVTGVPVASGATAAATVAKGAMMAMAAQKTTVLITAGVLLALGLGGGAVLVHSMTGSPKSSSIAVPAPTPAQTPTNVTFSDGTVVEMLGIAEIPEEMKDLRRGSPPPMLNWWGPNGSAAAPPPVDGFNQIWVDDGRNSRRVAFVFAVQGRFDRSTSLTVSVDHAGSSAQTTTEVGGRRMIYDVVSIPAQVDQVNLRVGLARGPWDEDASIPVAASAATRPATGPAVFGKVSEEDGKCAVEIFSSRIRGRATREMQIAAILTNGKTVGTIMWRTSMSGEMATFPCKKSEVARIAWQSRGYEWAQLKGVRVRPRNKANVTTRPVPAL